MENRHKNFLYSLLPTFMMLGLQMVAIIFLSEIEMVLVTKDFTGSTFNEYMTQIIEAMSNTDFTVYAAFLYSAIACVVFAIWYHAMRQQKTPDFKADLSEAAEKLKEAGEEAKGVFYGCKWTMIPGIIIFIVGLQFVCNYLVEFLGRMFPEWLTIYEQMLKASGLADSSLTWPVILYAAILGPVTEELAFRGVTYSYARRSMPLWAANIVQAILFAGMHMNPLQSAYALLFAFLLGYIYGKSRNIILVIIMHVGFNMTSVFIGDNLSTGDNPVSFFLILLTSLMATYFGFILILRSLPITVKVNPGDEY